MLCIGVSMAHNRSAFSEAFYTRPTVFKMGAAWLRKHCPSSKTFFDFSAGDGAISEWLPRGLSYHGIDIKPTNGRVHQADFLKMRVAEAADVVGFNPPFGRAGCLALRFVNQAITLMEPKWMLLVLPIKAWDFGGYDTVCCKVLPRESFWTPDTRKLFSTPAIMVLLRRRTVPAVVSIDRNPAPEWQWRDTAPLSLPRTASETVVLLRKVGVNAGLQAYMIARKGSMYEVTYLFRQHTTMHECAIPERGSLAGLGLPWEGNGHIVCDRDVRGSKTGRSGLGFLKCDVALPPARCWEGVRNLVSVFEKHNAELVMGSPPSICIGLVHFCMGKKRAVCI